MSPNDDLHDPYIFRGEGSAAQSLAREVERLGLRARRLQATLTRLEWGGPDARGNQGPCGACGQFPGQGHLDDCFLAAALRDRDSLTYAECLLHHLRDAVRTHRIALDAEMRRMTDLMADLEGDLDEVARILEEI